MRLSVTYSRRIGGILLMAAAMVDAVSGSVRAQDAAAARAIQFNRDIRPILSENCFQCHGPDAAHREADLRLDVREHAIADRDSGAAIVPNNAEKSQILERIRSSDPALRMPPESTGKQVTPEQIKLLEQWIAEGAPYEAHWSFVPPQKPPLPQVKNPAWPRMPLDYFTLAKMEEQGLSPSPEASRETWLRRVTLDLTGLPPTIEEQEAFLGDASPLAYERVVDRLLASAQYGERMAMHWLDLARYADTNGYNNDEERTQWPWRDWVIEAYNADMPYDQFVREQLAGDLLPGAGDREKIATAFNRNHVLTTEGGIIEEEYRVEYVADRVHTTASVFLGLSLQCARCHDHKYDPLSQRDYYRFFAFFNNIAEKTVAYNAARVSEPLVRAPTRLQALQLSELEQAIARVDNARSAHAQTVDAAVAEWEKQVAAQFGAECEKETLLADKLELHLPFDEINGDSTLDLATKAPRGKVIGSPKKMSGQVGGAWEFDGKTHVDFGETAAFEHDEPFSISVWASVTSNDAMTILAKMDEPQAHRGYDFVVEQGRPAMHLIHRWPEDGLKVIAKEPLPLGQRRHLVITYDGTAKAQGIKLYVDGVETPLDVSRDQLSGKGTIRTERPLHVGRRTTSIPFRGTLDDLRIYRKTLSADEAASLHRAGMWSAVAEVVKTPSADRTAEQRELLRLRYLETQDERYQTLSTELETLKKRKEQLLAAVPPTMVMAEMPTPRQAYILKRGQYDQPDEPVSPGVPESLPPLPPGAPANRLGLAQWLTNPEHPLTARVAVNRVWALLFGAGLVETIEDFGAQGAWPTHPELLDWLATEYAGPQQWGTKTLLKEIVLSATYRQSSRVNPELLQRDPKNLWLARGPRFRLPAETIRDSALATSGLLTSRIGGPSVKPYQPDGLWEEVSVERREKYSRDQGADLYRRSMYTFWKRTCPPPGMTTFDAPDRETCMLRRARTNTPLQALVLMNDPTYLEAARKMAERALREGGGSDDDRIDYLFRLAVSRRPNDRERGVLRTMLNQARSRFHTASEDALRLLTVGDAPRDESLEGTELASWTTLASIMLSLDETITKE